MLPGQEEGYLLRILIGEADKHEGKPLYEWIVVKAREQDLAGATVVRGIMGFGARSRIRTFKIERLSEDLPIIIEIIDSHRKLHSFLSTIEGAIEDGLVTIERANVLIYRSGSRDAQVEQAIAPGPRVGARLRGLRVGNVMTHDVTTVGPDLSVADVDSLLLRCGLKAVPVVDNGRVVGMITNGDLLRRAGMGLRVSLQRALSNPDIDEQLRTLRARRQTAAEVMTQPVVTVGDQANVAEATKVMAARHLKRLPVTDAAGRLVGIISRTDVLRLLTASAVIQAEPLELPAGAFHRAQDVMFRNVPVVGPTASFDEVLDSIMMTALRRVVVVDESRHVLGIVADADLIARISQIEGPNLLRTLLARLSQASIEALPLNLHASDLMTQDVFSVHADTPITDIVRLMLEKRVKRLVVTDPEGKLLGMVDRQTVLRVIADES